jgi:hypothetical protein
MVLARDLHNTFNLEERKMEKSIQFTGPKAVAALVVIAVVVGFQYFSHNQSLQTGAVDAIKTHLVAEYTRYHLPELQQAATGGTVDETRLEEIAGQLNAENIDIVSINARGRGGNYVARVEIRVDGSQPPDGKSVRYFKMSHSTVTGWRVLRESNPWSYHLAF